MPIHEEAFRIGCGRYLQKPGLLQEAGTEIARYGHKPLIVGGVTALSITRNTLEKSLQEAGLSYEIQEYTGTCNKENASTLTDYIRQNDFDMVVGVGGGVLMDYAKLTANLSGLPVINIPTSSATCAAYTPLSVCYTPDGRTIGTTHFGFEVTAVLADTAILAAQPPRLLLSGVFDALAKYVEIKQRYTEEVQDYPLGLDWAYVLAKKSFQVLSDTTASCLASMKAGLINDTVERLIYTTIAVTGVISGIARGSNQSAIAHKFYEGTRRMYFSESRKYLHGEIVGVGLLLQNFFNDELDHNAFLTSLMDQYSLPHRITDIGLTPSPEVQDRYYDDIKGGSAIDETNPEELRRLRAGLEYLWNL